MRRWGASWDAEGAAPGRDGPDSFSYGSVPQPSFDTSRTAPLSALVAIAA